MLNLYYTRVTIVVLLISVAIILVPIAKIASLTQSIRSTPLSRLLQTTQQLRTTPPLVAKMSSTAKSPTPAAAPWRSEFYTHVQEKMQSPEFVLASLHPATNDTSKTPAAITGASAPTPYVPRARFCIFRGFWTNLPENKHNDAERNPSVFESDCPTFTTDARMQKVPELFGTSAGSATERDQTWGSGGGGPVEAVWWVKDTMTQWRMKGVAYVVGNDIDDEKASSGVRTVKSEVGKRMRMVDQSGQEQWSWKRELRGHFGNCSPGMRGSFKQPPPGQPVDQKHDEKEKMGDKVMDLDDEVSRGNFRVVVIVPDEMERTELTDPDNARRHIWTWEEKGEWSGPVETWP